jgi:hypothetical protein
MNVHKYNYWANNRKNGNNDGSNTDPEINFYQAEPEKKYSQCVTDEIRIG